MGHSFPAGFETRFDLRREATPRPLLARPVHRWFVFPHSYGPGLVEAIFDRWGFDEDDSILDPFVGSGTTLRVAREHGMDAAGWDLSPLAALVSRVKVRTYDEKSLRRRYEHLIEQAVEDGNGTSHAIPLLRKALGPHRLHEARSLIQRVRRIRNPSEREFLLLGVLCAAREVSSARSDGGWLRWTSRRARKGRLVRAFRKKTELMMRDIAKAPRGSGRQDVSLADARCPRIGRVFDGVITSPPYPNRHDYSRVFAVELLLGFLDLEGLFRLRHRSLRSHVEARATAEPVGYAPPAALMHTVQALADAPVTDRRVRPMIDGYFKDMWIHLRAIRPLLRRGGRLAYVVGNVRHAGVMVPVDSILEDLAERAGYRSEGGWVIRERGNSAQQMNKFGRRPARESVVFLRRS